MKKLLIIVGLSVAFLTGVAQAQTSGTASGTANASTQSQSTGGQAQAIYAPTSNIGGTEYAVSSAIPAGLVAGMATCAGSTTAAVSAHIVSVSIGSVWKDDDCQAGNFSQIMWNQGQRPAALGVMCSRDVIRYAIATTGGIAYVRKDGVVVHRACPMRPEDWKKAGEPLLDPITGTPMTDEELNPPIKVVAEPNTVGPLTDAQQAAVLAKLSPEQKAALAKSAKIIMIEDHAKDLDKAAAVTIATK